MYNAVFNVINVTSMPFDVVLFIPFRHYGYIVTGFLFGKSLYTICRYGCGRAEIVAYDKNIHVIVVSLISVSGISGIGYVVFVYSDP